MGSCHVFCFFFLASLYIATFIYCQRDTVEGCLDVKLVRMYSIWANVGLAVCLLHVKIIKGIMSLPWYLANGFQTFQGRL